MSALPPSHLGAAGGDGDSTLDERGWERSIGVRLRARRWIGWRLRGLMAGALIGCLALFTLMRALMQQPVPDATLTLNARGEISLAAQEPQRSGSRLVDAAGTVVPVDVMLLQRSARWLPDDGQRARHGQAHDALAASLQQGALRWLQDDGSVVAVPVHARGGDGLGWQYWILSALALLLYLLSLVVVLTRPDLRNALFAVMGIAQAGNLMLIAATSTPALGWPAGFMHADLVLRTGFDLATGAALVAVTGLRPIRLPGQAVRGVAAGALAAVIWLGVATQSLPMGWWWTQGALIAAGLAAISQLLWMQWRRPHPLAALLLRFTSVALGTLVLLTVLVAVLEPAMDVRHQAGAIGGTIWVVFLAAILLMLPFLARTQQLMREFSLLAGVSTVATALDLLFVAVFSLGSFTSLTLALFISLAAYAGVRQWLIGRLTARERMTTERMFEHLYRMAREVQAHPEHLGRQLDALLRELFDPLDAHVVARRARRARVLGDGSGLVVPLPALAAVAPAGSLVLGFAERGRRLFTPDDARLADRVVDLIARAVAFDQAVERGRSEERVRIAQDLHDDIGARLLTLMYRAPTPEMEDYLRHTLKDLKTLTRGLAAPSHRLSHAVAEWKADLAQRLAVVDCELGWSFVYEHDFELSVVQWSALTRVLRELVSNAIAHAHATRVDVEATIEQGALQLSVIDNGRGRTPEAWAHGLGLGGVRKRVKQLGGQVRWSEHAPGGIACHVVVPAFAPAPA